MSTICAAPAQMPRSRSVLRGPFSHSRKCSTSNDVIQTHTTTANELPSLPSTDARPSRPQHSRTSSSSSSAGSPTTGTFPLGFASLASPASSVFSFHNNTGSSPASPTSSAFSLRAARNSIASLSSAISSASPSGAGGAGRKASLVGEAVRRMGPSSSNPDVELAQLPACDSAVAPRGYVPRRAKASFMASVTPLAERGEA